MASSLPHVEQLSGVPFTEINFNHVIDQGVPRVFKGALNESRLVQSAKQSSKAAMSFLAPFASDAPLLYYRADADQKSRFFYDDELNGVNFKTGRYFFDEFCSSLEQENAAANGDSIYVGSADLERHFPGLISSDGLGLPTQKFPSSPPLIGIWLGNQTTAVTHYDVSNNIAACMTGKRRFTLFPPDQIANLYPGPLEPTPGGQVVSMVNLNSPDFDRFPNFKAALEQAQVADLEPGDVLVYPAMWWHQVESFSDFNVLINYWWNTSDVFIDDPMNTLLHGLLSLRDRPQHEKDAWRSVFDYYVFGDAQLAREHLPKHIRGALDSFDASSARRHRAKLLKKFNR